MLQQLVVGVIGPCGLYVIKIMSSTGNANVVNPIRNQMSVKVALRRQECVFQTS